MKERQSWKYLHRPLHVTPYPIQCPFLNSVYTEYLYLPNSPWLVHYSFSPAVEHHCIPCASPFPPIVLADQNSSGHFHATKLDYSIFSCEGTLYCPDLSLLRHPDSQYEVLASPRNHSLVLLMYCSPPYSKPMVQHGEPTTRHWHQDGQEPELCIRFLVFEGRGRS